MRLAAIGLVFSTCLACASARAEASAPRKLTLYSVTTQEQYLNHADDRARGTGNNPFGNFKDTSTPAKTGGNGPFPGDRAVLTFALFGKSNLKTRIGSATFICTYTFSKNGFCSAAYLLNGGTILGTGYFNFSAGTFTVAIAGGTGTYRGARGGLLASPGAGHSQRLAVTLY